MIALAGEDDLASRLESCFTMDQIKGCMKDCSRPLHLTNPSSFKHLIRINVIKEYDFNQVCLDISNEEDHQLRDELCWSIRYAVDRGIFPKGVKKVLWLANEVKNFPKALDPLREAIELYLQRTEQPELLDEASYFINKLRQHSPAFERLRQAVANTSSKANRVETFDLQMGPVNREATVEVHQTITQQLTESEGIQQINIITARSKIVERQLDNDKETDLKESDGKDQTSWYRPTLLEFTEQLRISRKSSIGSKVLNEYIRQHLDPEDNRIRWSAQKIGIIGKAVAFLPLALIAGPHPLFAPNSIDQMVIVPMGINIVYNEMKFHGSKLDVNYQRIQLQFLQHPPEKWAGYYPYAGKTDELVSRLGPKLDFSYYQTETFNDSGIKDFVNEIQKAPRETVILQKKWWWNIEQSFIQRQEVNLQMAKLAKFCRIKCIQILDKGFNAQQLCSDPDILQRLSQLMESDPQPEVQRTARKIILSSKNETLNMPLFKSCMQMAFSDENDESSREYLEKMVLSKHRQVLFTNEPVVTLYQHMLRGDKHCFRDFASLLLETYFDRREGVPDFVRSKLVRWYLGNIQDDIKTKRLGRHMFEAVQRPGNNTLENNIYQLGKKSAIRHVFTTVRLNGFRLSFSPTQQFNNLAFLIQLMHKFQKAPKQIRHFTIFLLFAARSSNDPAFWKHARQCMSLKQFYFCILDRVYVKDSTDGTSVYSQNSSSGDSSVPVLAADLLLEKNGMTADCIIFCLAEFRRIQYQAKIRLVKAMVSSQHCDRKMLPYLSRCMFTAETDCNTLLQSLFLKIVQQNYDALDSVYEHVLRCFRHEPLSEEFEYPKEVRRNNITVLRLMKNTGDIKRECQILCQILSISHLRKYLLEEGRLALLRIPSYDVSLSKHLLLLVENELLSRLTDQESPTFVVFDEIEALTNARITFTSEFISQLVRLCYRQQPQLKEPFGLLLTKFKQQLEPKHYAIVAQVKICSLLTQQHVSREVKQSGLKLLFEQSKVTEVVLDQTRKLILQDQDFLEKESYFELLLVRGVPLDCLTESYAIKSLHSDSNESLSSILKLILMMVKDDMVIPQNLIEEIHGVVEEETQPFLEACLIDAYRFMKHGHHFDFSCYCRQLLKNLGSEEVAFLLRTLGDAIEQNQQSDSEIQRTKRTLTKALAYRTDLIVSGLYLYSKLQRVPNFSKREEFQNEIYDILSHYKEEHNIQKELTEVLKTTTFSEGFTRKITQMLVIHEQQHVTVQELEQKIKPGHYKISEIFLLATELQEDPEKNLPVIIRILENPNLSLSSQWLQIFHIICDFCDEIELPSDLLKTVISTLIKAAKFFFSEIPQVDRILETILLYGHSTEVLSSFESLAHPLAISFMALTKWTQQHYSGDEIIELSNKTWLLCCQPKCVIRGYAAALLEYLPSIRDPSVKNSILQAMLRMNTVQIQQIGIFLQEVIEEGEATAYTLAVYRYSIEMGLVEEVLAIQYLQPYLTPNDEELARGALELMCCLLCRMDHPPTDLVETLQQPLQDALDKKIYNLCQRNLAVAQNQGDLEKQLATRRESLQGKVSSHLLEQPSFLLLTVTCQYWNISSINLVEVLLYDLFSKIRIHYTEIRPEAAHAGDTNTDAIKELIEAGNILRDFDGELAMLLVTELEKLITYERCHLQDVIVLLSLVKKIGVEAVLLQTILLRKDVLIIAAQQLLGDIGKNYSFVKMCVQVLGAHSCVRILNARQKSIPRLRPLVEFLHNNSITCNEYFHPSLLLETVLFHIKLSTCLAKTKTVKNKVLACILERLLKDPSVSYEKLILALPETVYIADQKSLEDSLKTLFDYQLTGKDFYPFLSKLHRIRMQSIGKLFLDTPVLQGNKTLDKLLEEIKENNEQVDQNDLKLIIKQFEKNNDKQLSERNPEEEEQDEKPTKTGKVIDWLKSPLQCLPFQKEMSIADALVKFQAAVRKIKRVELKKTQLMSIYIGVQQLRRKDSTRGAILQVSTGEGKSLITAGIAAVAIMIRIANCVDIATSQSVLAKRDAENNQQLFKCLKLTCAHNLDPSEGYEKGLKLCYQANIVYGDANQFQFDWLRENYAKLGTQGSRGKGKYRSIILVDEADNVMIDNMFYIARLSTSFPGAESLQFIYYVLWDAFLKLMGRLVSINGSWYLLKGKILSEEPKIRFEYCLDPENGTQIIEDLAKFFEQTSIPIDEVPFVEYKSKKENFDVVVRQQCKLVFKECLQKMKSVVWSKGAMKFAQESLDGWIKSVINAFIMREKQNYICNNGKIRPVDFQNTGVVQTNTSLSNGLHQFLQAKHLCRITSQTRTTNYLSNYSFFKQYGKGVIGLTGTVGTEITKQIFRIAYDCDCYIIPRSMHERTYALPIQVLPKEEWGDEIVRCALRQTSKKKAVLIICLTVSLTQQLFQLISRVHPRHKIRLYNDNNNVDQNRSLNRCQSGDIIIATNLAGRGTDIPTSDQVEKSGGLHIILTYLPNSQRVQKQAEGRTGRNGNRGTTQIVVSRKQGEEDPQKAREAMELAFLHSLQFKLQKIDFKDRKFKEYMDWLDGVRDKYKAKTITTEWWTDLTVSCYVSEIEDRFAEIVKRMDDMEDITDVIQWRAQCKKINSEFTKFKTACEEGIEEFKKLNSGSDLKKDNFNIQKCIIQNGCYLLQLANSILNSYFLKAFEGLCSRYIQVAARLNPSDFNVHYLRACILLKGTWGLIVRNKKDNYREDALISLKQAEEQLLLELASYESTLNSLRDKSEITSHFFVQMEAKAKMLEKCMNSIQSIRGSVEASVRMVSVDYTKDDLNWESFNMQHRHKSCNLIKRRRQQQKVRVQLHSLTPSNLTLLQNRFFWQRCSQGMKKYLKLESQEGGSNSSSTSLRSRIKSLLQDPSVARMHVSSVTICFKPFSAKTFPQLIPGCQFIVLLPGELFKNAEVNERAKRLVHAIYTQATPQEVYEPREMEQAVSQQCRFGERPKVYRKSEIHQHTRSYRVQTGPQIQLKEERELFKSEVLRHDPQTTSIFEEPEEFRSNNTEKPPKQPQLLKPSPRTIYHLLISSQEDIDFLEQITNGNHFELRVHFSSCSSAINCLDRISTPNQEEVLYVIMEYDEGSYLATSVKDIQKQGWKYTAQFLFSNKRTAQRFLEKYSQLELTADVDTGEQTRLSDQYHEAGCPVAELMEMQQRGFEMLFTAHQRKPIPFWPMVAMGSVFAVQIIAGTLLVWSGVGSPVGAALITESLNEVFAMRDILYSREFCWKSYLFQKTISLALTATTLGLSQIKTAGNGLMKAGKIVASEIGEKGLIQSAKCLFKGSTLKLLSKQFMLELGERALTQTLNAGITYGLEKIKEFLARELQTLTSGMLETGRWTSECCKRIIVLNGLRLTDYTFQLHEELEKALNPNRRSNPYVAALWTVLNRIGDYFIEKKGNSMIGNLLQGYNFVESSTRIQRELILQVPLVSDAIEKHLLKVVYETCSIEQTLTNYLRKHGFKPNDIRSWFCLLVKQKLVIQPEIIQSTAQQVLSIGLELIPEDCRLGRLFEQPSHTIEQYNYDKIRDHATLPVKIKEYFANLERNINEVKKEQLSEGRRKVSDYLLKSLFETISAGVIQPYLRSKVAALTSHLRAEGDKLLANMNDHNENDRIRYDQLRRKENPTEEQQEWMQRFESPTVSGQLASVAQYNAGRLASKYKEIALREERSGEPTAAIFEQCEYDIGSIIKEDRLSETNMIVAAKEKGMEIRITQDPSDKLTVEQKNRGVVLALYQQGQLNSSGQDIGHFKVMGNTGWKDPHSQSKEGCGYAVLAYAVKEKTGKDIKKDEIKSGLINGIRNNPLGYCDARSAEKLISGQFPSSATSINMVGGKDSKKEFKQLDKKQRKVSKKESKQVSKKDTKTKKIMKKQINNGVLKKESTEQESNGSTTAVLAGATTFGAGIGIGILVQKYNEAKLAYVPVPDNPVSFAYLAGSNENHNEEPKLTADNHWVVRCYRRLIRKLNHWACSLTRRINKLSHHAVYLQTANIKAVDDQDNRRIQKYLVSFGVGGSYIKYYLDSDGKVEKELETYSESFNDPDCSIRYPNDNSLTWADIHQAISKVRDKKYDVLSWNCQDFAKEILNVLGRIPS